jgi:hypothetical protein
MLDRCRFTTPIKTPAGHWRRASGLRNSRSNYLDVSNDPLYPFGYGLSYTEFGYGDVKLSAAEITPADSLDVSIEVTNKGSREGSEVVQLYIRDLVGFRNPAG